MERVTNHDYYVALATTSIAFGLVTATIARARGYGVVTWFISGAILWWIGLAAILTQPKTEAALVADAEAAGMGRCPTCGQFVWQQAQRCPWCSTHLQPIH